MLSLFTVRLVIALLFPVCCASWSTRSIARVLPIACPAECDNSIVLESEYLLQVQQYPAYETVRGGDHGHHREDGVRAAAAGVAARDSNAVGQEGLFGRVLEICRGRTIV